MFPGFTNANNHDIELITNSEDLIVYQKTDSEGNLIEINESITVEGNITEVIIEEFVVEGNEKHLKDKNVQVIEETDREIIIYSNDSRQGAVLNLDNLEERAKEIEDNFKSLALEQPQEEYNTLAKKCNYKEGGSYVAVWYYTIYSDCSAQVVGGVPPNPSIKTQTQKILTLILLQFMQMI